MRRIKMVIVLIILFMPICIKAFSYENYDKSIKNTNNYINKYNDKNKYLIFNKPYVYYSGASLYRMPGETETDFKYGGLLSYDEYNISKGNNSSYLAIGRDYWTLTPYESEQYYVDNTILHRSRDQKAGIRVTQFVKPTTLVDGNGSYSSPWVFTEKYKLTIKVESTTYGGVSYSDRNVYTNSISTMVSPNSVYSFKVKENKGYSYVSSDCNITQGPSISDGVYSFTTSSIKKDTICTINYEKRKITVKYNCGTNGGTPPETVNLRYGQDYSIADYVCSKKGYNQVKWKTSNGYEWAKEETGVSTLEDGTRGLVDYVLTLEPVWNIKKFKVTYKGNGGTYNGDSSWSEYVTYNNTYKVWKNFFRYKGYRFAGWYDPSGKNWAVGWSDKWTFDNGEYGIKNDTLELTAKWTASNICSETVKKELFGKSCDYPTLNWKSGDYTTAFTAPCYNDAGVYIGDKSIWWTIYCGNETACSEYGYVAGQTKLETIIKDNGCSWNNSQWCTCPRL